MTDVDKDLPSEHPALRGDNVPSESSQMKIESASWLGPLPPPGALRLFEDIVPGSAERILAMAEKQEDHRIQMERKIIRGDFTQSYLGLAAGFVLSTMVILGGIYLISLGHDWAGGGLIGLNLVGLAGVFVYGSNIRRLPPRELVENAEETDEMGTE